MRSQNIPWDAISARLKNETNDEQLLQITEWLELSAENPAILSEIVNIWSLTKSKSQFYQPDNNINWQKLMKRIDRSAGHNFQLNVYYRWIAAASVIVFVFLAGLGFGDKFFNHKAKVTLVRIIAPEGSKTQIVLPDSTHVWLNSGAMLQYPSDFTSQNRKVTMKGECFFDVTKDPENPFLVNGSDFRVKVYGTRFNVNESNTANRADLTLVSGIVEVYSLNNRLLLKLNPGQQLVYNNGTSFVRNAENIQALTSWIDNMLIFENKPFEEVIFYLEKWYGVKINLDRSTYYKNNYTFKVKTESLREVLELISFITPIEYRIEGEQVTIKYKQIDKKMKK